MAKTNKTIKITVTTLVALVVIVGGYLAYAYSSNVWPFTESAGSDTPITDSSSKTNKPDVSALGEESSGATTDAPDPADKIPKQYETPTNNKNTAPDTLHSTLNTNINGDKLMVRVTITELISDGTCTLTLSKDRSTITKTAGIADNPSTSSCAGWDIPLSELSPGTWSVKVNITSGDKSGQANGSVNI